MYHFAHSILSLFRISKASEAWILLQSGSLLKKRWLSTDRQHQHRYHHCCYHHHQDESNRNTQSQWSASCQILATDSFQLRIHVHTNHGRRLWAWSRFGKQLHFEVGDRRSRSHFCVGWDLLNITQPDRDWALVVVIIALSTSKSLERWSYEVVDSVDNSLAQRFERTVAHTYLEYKGDSLLFPCCQCQSYQYI